MKIKAEHYLKKALNNPNASFRTGQWENIEQLLQKKRILVVESTGWGKSIVYFLATKLLREQGEGPTLLISPLLSLMRNQIETAEKLGVKAYSINSTNKENWEEITQKLHENSIDILLISPERLANEEFINTVLLNFNIGLFVVDEAHCISDWGHDFRPDYKRIISIIQNLPLNIPILATTATANNRVVDDIKTHLETNLTTTRGNLVRTSLKLQNIHIPQYTARLAWLAEIVPLFKGKGSGIIYALTKRDTETISEWLEFNGVNARAYHAGLENGQREFLEQELLNNKLDTLVATVALGMGFDKPDIAFVIHFQCPSSVVHYYQQVGRAGRAIPTAYGILLSGEEDTQITDYFIDNAFPAKDEIQIILEALTQTVSITELESKVNLSRSNINKILKFLTVDRNSPLMKVGSEYVLKVMENPEKMIANYLDKLDEFITRITQVRKKEQEEMQEYINYTGCLMNFLQNSLDDINIQPCEKCKNCSDQKFPTHEYNKELAKKALSFLRQNYIPIQARKKFPTSNILEKYNFTKSFIPKEFLAQEGFALSIWNDEAWGKLVAKGKYEDNFFADELVLACVRMLNKKKIIQQIHWLTCVPSLRRPLLVQNFAERLAKALNLPFIPCIEKVLDTQEQKKMENSYQKVKNLDGAFKITDDCKKEACLLVDDIINSGWTFTIISALLSQAGCSAVFPIALAQNPVNGDV